MTTNLTVDYFVGELCIPNITGTSPAATANANNVKWFIGKYEPRFLELLLGSDLYAEFSAGMTVVAPAVPDAKWTALKNKIYVVDTQNNAYLSPAANYVYYHVMRDRITMTASVGEVKPDNSTASNPQAVSNTQKMILAWNSIEDDAAKIWEYLEDNPALYPSFDPTQKNPFSSINMWNL